MVMLLWRSGVFFVDYLVFGELRVIIVESFIVEKFWLILENFRFMFSNFNVFYKL